MTQNTPANRNVQNQGELDAQFVRAARMNDLRGAAAALDKGANINTPLRKDSGNMLVHSLYSGHQAMAHFLMDRGIEVNTHGFSHNTPLMKSVTTKDIELAQKLLRLGADPNWPRFEDRPSASPGLHPLHQACIYGDLDMAELLVQNGADIDRCARNGGSPLWYAAANGRQDVVCMLINAGANPEAPFRNIRFTQAYGPHGIPLSNTGRTTVDVKYGLHHPASSGHIEVLHMLLDAGADMNAKDDNGKTALEYAKQWTKNFNPKVEQVFERYGQYPMFDIDRLNTLGKADLFEPNEHGYCLMDSPSTWKHIKQIDAHLQTKGEPLMLEDLEKRNKHGATWLQRGVECFATERVLDMCLREDGRVVVERLVERDGSRSGLLDAMINRHQVGHLLSAEAWHNNRSMDFRKFMEALPEEQRNRMPDHYLVYHQMRNAEQDRNHEGYGRSMVDRYGKRSESPRQIF